MCCKSKVAPDIRDELAPRHITSGIENGFASSTLRLTALRYGRRAFAIAWVVIGAIQSAVASGQDVSFEPSSEIQQVKSSGLSDSESEQLDRAMLGVLKALQASAIDTQRARAHLNQARAIALRAPENRLEHYVLWLEVLVLFAPEVAIDLQTFSQDLAAIGRVTIPSSRQRVNRELITTSILYSIGQKDLALERRTTFLGGLIRDLATQTPEARDAVPVALEMMLGAQDHAHVVDFANSIATTLGPTDALTFRAWRTASFALRLAEKYDEALVVAQRAYNAARSIDTAFAERVRMSTASELGTSYAAIGDPITALPLLEFARDEAMRLHPVTEESRAWVWLATGHAKLRLGDSAGALADYERANLEISRRVSRGEPLSVFSRNEQQINRLWMANAFIEAGNRSEAIRIFDDVSVRFDLTQMVDTWIHAALPNIALALSEVGRLADAERVLSIAREQSLKISGVDNGALSDISVASAIMRSDTGQMESARTELVEALAIDLSGRDRFRSANAWFALAMQLEKTAKVDASIYAYKLGAIAAQQGRLRTQANLQRLDGPLPRYDKPLRSLITLLIQRERIVEAEYLMNELWQEEHFRYIRRSARPGAWNGARRSSNLPGRPLTDVEDFFVPTEQALLTRTLELETISTRVSAAIKQAAGLAPTWSAFARMDNQSNSSLDVERAALRSAVNEHVQAVAAFAPARASRVVHDFNRTSSAVPIHFGATNTQRLPRGVDAHLRILATDTGFIGWVRDRNGVRVVRLPHSRQAVLDAVIALRSVLRRDDTDARPAAQLLWRMLIAPFARVSNGLRSGVVHVEVDGILRYVPFAALHDGRRFWVERATVRQYEPRASQNHARKRNHVFTGSQASPRGVLVAVSAANSANGTESLPFANAEVASIAEIWRAKRGAQGVVRNDIDASEFRRLIATEPTLLHVAAHFKLVPGDETRSFLSLAKGDRLSVFDLRNMDFTKTKLVVLSACDTSLDMADGAEIGGLPRVLLEAGAGSVVGTLWAISDQSTSAWMETMYRQLNIVGVDRVADAITITQRAFLSDPLLPKAWRHPYHWAAFSLMASTQ